ncbi:hypothetical protein I79_001923 [Cricetulus griseus]|uniref:Uncharacterized protein n=1 Tax=Cricetulus griseus TaxID=10029 RepID=G3GW13_CRIGR|nr:hypothetical protein I79_001923 [Cricetulus griseus]
MKMDSNGVSAVIKQSCGYGRHELSEESPYETRGERRKLILPFQVGTEEEEEKEEEEKKEEEEEEEEEEKEEEKEEKEEEKKKKKKKKKNWVQFSA